MPRTKRAGSDRQTVGALCSELIVSHPHADREEHVGVALLVGGLNGEDVVGGFWVEGRLGEYWWGGANGHPFTVDGEDFADELNEIGYRGESYHNGTVLQ